MLNIIVIPLDALLIGNIKLQAYSQGDEVSQLRTKKTPGRRFPVGGITGNLR